MVLNLTEDSVIIFDLDDTLYKEINFVHSAFLKIAEKLYPIITCDIYDELISLFHSKEDVFGTVLKKYKITEYSKTDLLEIYRNHFPNISLIEGAQEILESFKRINVKMGLVTDGRSVTQRNKLKSLGIEGFFECVIISEEFGTAKPDIKNFKFFTDKYKGSNFTYIADNTDKDFIAPNLLSWNTICLLDDGKNIHKQNINCDKKKAPQNLIKSFHDMEIIYEF